MEAEPEGGEEEPPEHPDRGHLQPRAETLPARPHDPLRLRQRHEHGNRAAIAVTDRGAAIEADAQRLLGAKPIEYVLFSVSDTGTGIPPELIDKIYLLESEGIKAAYGFDSVVGHYASPFHPGSAYVLLHHCFGEVNGKRGAWGHALGGMGAISEAIAAGHLLLEMRARYEFVDQTKTRVLTDDANAVLTISYLVADHEARRLQATAEQVQRRLLTLGALGSQSFTYDPNDRIVGNSYDANGNTLASGARTFAYDSQNRLVASGSG